MKPLPYSIYDRLATSLGEFSFYSLRKLAAAGRPVDQLPFSIRILVENVLRHFDGQAIAEDHLEALLEWNRGPANRDVPFKPARVLMQDFTGVPAMVDLASLRSEMARQGKDPQAINPRIPVDLVVDHSLQVDFFGSPDACARNEEMEYTRNRERYQFLKWAQTAFDNFSLVPPGMGICHQVNLEYLAQGVTIRDGVAMPDTLVGTDSHTPMVNGIGVVGWGVGGIEAEAALLGQPIFFPMPEVVGLKLSGRLPAGTTATDLVLAITHLLRSRGVVGKFVEVFGDGLAGLTVPDRATIANMSPEFGCTVTYFPVDERTLDYMRQSNRPAAQVELVEAYCKANLLWRTGAETITYSSLVELKLETVEATLAGPARPQDKILLREAQAVVRDALSTPRKRVEVDLDRQTCTVGDGSVAIAAITSCTNTSNPSVMIGAGLLARKARARGLEVKPWVKTSFAPGSKVVTDYLTKSGLMEDLAALGFHLVGYGCTTCIGNSGPLPPPIAKAVDEHRLAVAAVLSGNRNFEARVHPQVRMNFLMSPILVVAYALAGEMEVDLVNQPLSCDPNGNPIYLKDIWPAEREIEALMAAVLNQDDFEKNYADIAAGDEQWLRLEAPRGPVYPWDASSTYIKEAPFFVGLPARPDAPGDLHGARALLVLGDSVTTDHISPAGAFAPDSPAGRYLSARGVAPEQFNSYGSRRGNDEVMVRGTFANVRIRNQLVEREGGYTLHLPSGDETTVYEAAQRYTSENIPLLVLAGKDYGSGSSRDWAAKGASLLGIKAVIAEGYERIHRSNLVGMGILPLQYQPGENARSLGLTGRETFSVTGIAEGLGVRKLLAVVAVAEDGRTTQFTVVGRIDSPVDVSYYEHGGILHRALRGCLAEASGLPSTHLEA